MGWISWIEDPRFSQRPPPGEPNWRKVILAMAAIAIIVAETRDQAEDAAERVISDLE